MESFFTALLDKLLNNGLPSEKETELLCETVIDILIKEPNIRYISSPVVVVGDIHGQYHDLQHLLQIEGPPGLHPYIFLGDYVDRGENSLECIFLLLIYKALYPEMVTLLRGNHEIKSINKIYGFYDEVMERYGDSSVWSMINNVFIHFNIGAIVDNRYFCVHGGISSRVSIAKLQRLDRFERIAEDSILTDIMWSDPYYKPGTTPNPRGSGFLFGEDVLKRFLMHNNIDMIIRSHQLAIEGYKWNFTPLCLTVWSAPNYMGKCSNPASILVIQKGQPITNSCLRLFKKAKKKISNEIE